MQNSKFNLFFVFFLPASLLALGFWLLNPQTAHSRKMSTVSATTSSAAEVPQPQVLESATKQNLNTEKMKASIVKPVISSTLSRIRSSKLINQIETEVDAYGIRSTLSVYETDMKYPLVLLEEDWKEDGRGSKQLVGWRGMAANQLLIRGSVAKNSKLQNLLNSYGAEVEETRVPGVYRVNFDGTDPMNLHDLAADLSETEGVKSAEPNYIISIEH